jgi:L-threonylcarbamoyladenylate synthase
MDPIGQAVRVLQRDGLVVYPTDTVYGLGADAFSDDAIRRVYDAKQRPLSQPISIAVADLEMAQAVACIDEAALVFMERVLPGPVTVVLRAKTCLPEILTGGTGLIGIRIPAHPVPEALTRMLDGPITATSANLHGDPDPATTNDVRVPHDLMIEGGKLPGTPSTVVDLVHRCILRQGEGWRRVEAVLSAPR